MPAGLGDSKLVAELIPDTGVLALVKVFIESFAVVLANIEHAPVNLSRMDERHLFEDGGMLAMRLVRFYAQGEELVWQCECRSG